ncbi:MAG TPA: hypothetical protein VFW34_05960 [Candidatus Rubrimentiphilum sp.]|nr:hypothetical protein [Candidatus Rubrimentiphilum sp.]
MHRPQKLAAAFLSAALLCTTGIAFADKGGNHGGSSSHGAATAPGQSSTGGAAAQRGPGGIGAPRSAPGDFDRNMGKGREFEGSAGDRDIFGSGAKAGVHVKLSNGGTQDFDISEAAVNSLKAHQGRNDLIFFTNGRQITAVSARGEKDDMRVIARSGNTFTLQDRSGQTRMITLDGKTANRLHVKVGANLQVTAMSATSGRVVALDLMKKHEFDKFARVTKANVDVDVAKTDIHRAKTDVDVAQVKKVKKQDIDAVKVDIDRVKADIDNAKTKKSKKLDSDVAKLDNDRRKLDIDTPKVKKTDVDVDVDAAKADIDRAKVDVDVAKLKKAKKADIDVVKADIDAVKTDVDTAKTKKSKKLDVDVAKLDSDQQKLDVDVARGACGHGSSRSGNPAFANQMAKDAANDASGHNPPGLPHECVNPAGHTRGFCKSSGSESICGGGSGSMGGSSDVDVAKTDVDVTKSGMGKCGHGSSRSGNPAFANQMAKDAANDASGHNPPGLPHECVNPAGHTRGFCKSSSSESICGGGSSGAQTVGVTPSETHGGIASSAVPAPRSGVAPGTVATVPANGGTSRAAIVSGRGFMPSQSGTRGSTRGASPTHVLGASTGPTRGRRIAALPTRVLPVAIQPVGKRRCVWYKTGVLGASSGPHYIVRTSAIAGKPVLHKKCR